MKYIEKHPPKKEGPALCNDSVAAELAAHVRIRVAEQNPHQGVKVRDFAPVIRHTRNEVGRSACKLLGSGESTKYFQVLGRIFSIGNTNCNDRFVSSKSHFPAKRRHNPQPNPWHALFTTNPTKLESALCCGISVTIYCDKGFHSSYKPRKIRCCSIISL